MEVKSDLIAVIAGGLHDGPINLRIAAASINSIGVTTGQQWSVGSTFLESRCGSIIDFAHAETWGPKPIDNGIDRTRLARGLDALHNHLLRHPLPNDGLARLVLSNAPAWSIIEQAASSAICRLETALQACFLGLDPGSVDDVNELIGLGPGLTPSGDDLLGGMLITCCRLSETSVAERLGETILKSADRTNVVSQAHLRAAALGYGAAPLHDLLDAILRNDRQDIAEALDATAKIGHSSGVDALAGMVLALRNYLAATSD